MKKLLIFLVLLSYFKLSFAITDYQKYSKLMSMAWEMRQEQKYDEAILYYQEASKYYSEQKDVKVGVFYSLIEKGDFKRAEKIAKLLIKDYPENLWVRKGSAWVFYSNKNYKESAKEYEFLINNLEDSYEMRMGLGLSYYYGDNWDKAKEVYNNLKQFEQFNADYRSKIFNFVKPKEWYVKPQIYFSNASYSSGDLESDAASVFQVNADNYYGYGAVFHGVSVNSKIKSTGDSKKTILGAGFYKANKKRSFWGHYLRINSDSANGNIISLSGKMFKEKFSLGLSGDVGLYGTLKTIQISTDAETYANKNLSLKVLPMFQSNFTSGSDSETYRRFSMEYIANIYTTNANLSASYFHGERWYTVSDNGMSAYNSDILFDSGYKLSFTLFPRKKYNLFLSYGSMHAKEQNGSSTDIDVVSYVGGITLNF